MVVDDVEDMQRKNAYLVATVRTLTDELESLGGGAQAQAQAQGAAGGSSEEVAALLAEVEAMRAARQRQEEMVSAIVRQVTLFPL